MDGGKRGAALVTVAVAGKRRVDFKPGRYHVDPVAMGEESRDEGLSVGVYDDVCANRYLFIIE